MDKLLIRGLFQVLEPFVHELYRRSILLVELPLEMLLKTLALVAKGCDTAFYLLEAGLIVFHVMLHCFDLFGELVLAQLYAAGDLRFKCVNAELESAILHFL